MLILSAVDLGLQIDFGRKEPGGILQRLENDIQNNTRLVESSSKARLNQTLHRQMDFGRRLHGELR